VARARRFDERGSATIEMVFWLPVLFGVMFLAMQGALYYYGRSAALAIANAGVRAAAVEGGTTGTCETAAESMRARVGDALTGVSIRCDRSPTAATVSVEGTTLSVFPLVLPTTTQQVSLPVERVT